MHSGILRDDNNIMRGRHKLLNERQGQLNLTWEVVVEKGLERVEGKQRIIHV